MNDFETVLFLCTGNYYRSRMAELYFNELARNRGLAWRAESRGLQPDPDLLNPISYHTIAWLSARGITVPDPVRYPLAATAEDFETAQLVVAVKEVEHRPLMEQHFPDWLDQVEFWHIHDLDCAPSSEALPQLAARVEELVTRLSS